MPAGIFLFPSAEGNSECRAPHGRWGFLCGARRGVTAVRGKRFTAVRGGYARRECFVARQRLRGLTPPPKNPAAKGHKALWTPIISARRGEQLLVFYE